MSDLGSRLRTTLQTFPWVTMGFPLGLRPLLPSHLVRKWGGGKPPVWGLLLIWDYPLPSLMEVIHRGNTDPALDQIIKTEISRKVLSPSLISRFYHLFMEPSPPGTRRGGGGVLLPLPYLRRFPIYLGVISATFLPCLQRVLVLSGEKPSKPSL